MDVESRHSLARKSLFPQSPVKFHSYYMDGFSSDPDTIGPMSPLSSPGVSSNHHSFDQGDSPSSRRSPRIARRRVITSETKLSDFESIDETPTKIFMTPQDVHREDKKSERIIVEESPDISISTPKNMRPQSKEKAKEATFYSPSSGINCSSFYQKPKARLSLFTDFMSKSNAAVMPTKKRTRSISADSIMHKKANPHKRPRIAPVNKNVRHGIKKPVKKVAGNKPAKSSLNITPEKKMPLISPTDRLQVFMDDTEIAEVLAEIREQQKVKAMKKKPAKPKKALPPTVIEKVASPKSDPTKKFFKTNRTMEINRVATVTVDKNIKLQVTNGKISLQKPVAKLSKNSFKTRKFMAELMDFETLEKDEVEVKVQKKVETILDQLSKNDGKENDVDSANIMSPGGNIAALTSSTSKISIGDDIIAAGFLTPPAGSSSPLSDEKLYPLFYKGNVLPQLATSPRRSPRGAKRQWQPISENQYQIDAGQRRFGATQCKECGLCYQMGEPDDEMQHQQYHDNTRNLKYTAWKNERVANSYENGRVIAIFPGDNKYWWNKAMQVLEVVDKELGCPPMEHDLKNSKVYLFVHAGRVVGCLSCTPVKVGYKMLTSISDIDCCSEESYPVKMGITRMWTAEPWRRKKVASRLLDCMRSTSMFGTILAKEEIAFSVPTVLGKCFATSYTQSNEFFVYL